MPNRPRLTLSICLQSGSPFPFALFSTAVWLLGEDNPSVPTALSHAKEELSLSHKQGEVSDWLRDSCPRRCRPISDLEESREEVVSAQLPDCCYRWQTPYHLCVCVGECVCVRACLVPGLRACLYRLGASVCVYMCNQSTAYTTCIFILIGEGVFTINKKTNFRLNERICGS